MYLTVSKAKAESMPRLRLGEKRKRHVERVVKPNYKGIAWDDQEESGCDTPLQKSASRVAIHSLNADELFEWVQRRPDHVPWLVRHAEHALKSYMLQEMSHEDVANNFPDAIARSHKQIQSELNAKEDAKCLPRVRAQACADFGISLPVYLFSMTGAGDYRHHGNTPVVLGMAKIKKVNKTFVWCDVGGDTNAFDKLFCDHRMKFKYCNKWKQRVRLSDHYGDHFEPIINLRNTPGDPRPGARVSPVLHFNAGYARPRRTVKTHYVLGISVRDDICELTEALTEVFGVKLVVAQIVEYM